MAERLGDGAIRATANDAVHDVSCKAEVVGDCGLRFAGRDARSNRADRVVVDRVVLRRRGIVQAVRDRVSHVLGVRDDFEIFDPVVVLVTVAMVHDHPFWNGADECDPYEPMNEDASRADTRSQVSAVTFATGGDHVLGSTNAPRARRGSFGFDRSVRVDSERSVCDHRVDRFVHGRTNTTSARDIL